MTFVFPSVFVLPSFGGLILDRTVSDPNFKGMAVFTPVINGEPQEVMKPRDTLAFWFLYLVARHINITVFKHSFFMAKHLQKRKGKWFSCMYL